VWDREIADPPKREAEPIGIDRGIEVFAALSTGELIDPIDAGKKILKRAQMQRRLARKLKHFNNWNKTEGEDRAARPPCRKPSQRLLAQGFHRPDLAKNQDRCRNHDRYKTEDLRVANNRSILDQAWA
jgi:transposase